MTNIVPLLLKRDYKWWFCVNSQSKRYCNSTLNHRDRHRKFDHTRPLFLQLCTLYTEQHLTSQTMPKDFDKMSRSCSTKRSRDISGSFLFVSESFALLSTQEYFVLSISYVLSRNHQSLHHSILPRRSLKASCKGPSGTPR